MMKGKHLFLVHFTLQYFEDTVCLMRSDTVFMSIILGHGKVRISTL